MNIFPFIGKISDIFLTDHGSRYCDYLFTRCIMCTKDLSSFWPTGKSLTNKKQIKAYQQAEINRSQKTAAEIALLELEKSLCQGMTRMLMALKISGILKRPSLPYNTERNRFEQRFTSFWILERPEPLGFEAFQSSTKVGQQDLSKVSALSFLHEVVSAIVNGGPFLWICERSFCCHQITFICFYCT